MWNESSHYCQKYSITNNKDNNKKVIKQVPGVRDNENEDSFIWALFELLLVYYTPIGYNSIIDLLYPFNIISSNIK